MNATFIFFQWQVFVINFRSFPGKSTHIIIEYKQSFNLDIVFETYSRTFVRSADISFVRYLNKARLSLRLSCSFSSVRFILIGSANTEYLVSSSSSFLYSFCYWIKRKLFQFYVWYKDKLAINISHLLFQFQVKGL